MNYLTKPITEWPAQLTPFDERTEDVFRANYESTLDLLDKEIYQLGGENIVMYLALRFIDFRKDGTPFANARPEHPGVIVEFDCDEGPLRFYTDHFDNWQANLRAIALAMEALRKVSRYGVNQKGSQYTGYKALPEQASPDAAGNGLLTPDDAARVISKLTGVEWQMIYDSKAVYELALKTAKRKAHPDAGGSHSAQIELNEAVEVLNLKFRDA